MCKLKYWWILIKKTSNILGKIGEELSSDRNTQLALFWPLLDKNEGPAVCQVFLDVTEAILTTEILKTGHAFGNNLIPMLEWLKFQE